MSGQTLHCLFGHSDPPKLVWHLPNAPDLLRCPRCGLVFLRNIPQRDPTTAYDAAYFENYARFRRDFQRVADRECERLGRYVQPPGRFLDVGAGLGFHVVAAVRQGWTAHGIEVSSWAASFAKRELDVDLILGSLTDFEIPPESADVVLLHHVLEHVVSPGEVLERIASTLSPNGVLFVGVPNWSGILRVLTRRRWAHLAPQHHLWHFTAQTLRRLLKRSGFDVETIVSDRGFPQPAIGFRPTPKMLFNEAVKSVYVFHWFGRGESLFAVARKSGG